MESSSSTTASKSATKMWKRACNLPVPRRSSGLVTKSTQACFKGFFQCILGGWLEERRPILTNGIADACHACQSTTRRQVNKFLPVDTPQILLFSHKTHPSLLQGLFSMQMRGVRLKNGVPYQQMGLSTLVSHVSRRPEEQRTSFTQSVPRRFFSLASRHSTSGIYTSAEHKIANQSA